MKNDDHPSSAKVAICSQPMLDAQRKDSRSTKRGSHTETVCTMKDTCVYAKRVAPAGTHGITPTLDSTADDEKQIKQEDNNNADVRLLILIMLITLIVRDEHPTQQLRVLL